jgi:Cu-Zn family superoxide dismutase
MKQRLSRIAGFSALLLSALSVAGLLAAGTVFAGSNPGPPRPKPPVNNAKAGAVLKNGSGRAVGAVALTRVGAKVLVTVSVHGLTPGFHGFHVHTVGNCTAPAFTSAGAHFNPKGVSHAQHAADLPPLLVNGDGTGEARIKTDRFAIADLRDADGSAFIVHANADNLANIPTRYHSHTEDKLGPDSATLATGDAGDRTACGVVR